MLICIFLCLVNLYDLWNNFVDFIKTNRENFVSQITSVKIASANMKGGAFVNAGYTRMLLYCVIENKLTETWE